MGYVGRGEGHNDASSVTRSAEHSLSRATSGAVKSSGVGGLYTAGVLGLGIPVEPMQDMHEPKKTPAPSMQPGVCFSQLK